MNRLAGRKAHAVIVQIRVCDEVIDKGSNPLDEIITTAGIKNGSRKPNAMLTRASRCRRKTTSPPVVGSKVGRFVHTLNARPRDGQLPDFSAIRKTASDTSEIR